MSVNIVSNYSGYSESLLQKSKLKVVEASFCLKGRVLNPGLVRGQLIKHQSLTEIAVAVTNDPINELNRLERARLEMQGALHALFTAEDLNCEGDHQQVFDFYKLLVQDRVWWRQVCALVEQGYTAESAIQKAQESVQDRFGQVQDAHLREKIYDLQDVSNRLLYYLNQGEKAVRHFKMSEDVIVVAEAMSPAELLEYDRRFLKGLILGEGSLISHVTIVARALDIPVLASVEGLHYQDPPKGQVILDGYQGQLVLNPSIETLAQYQKAHALEPETIKLTMDGPAITADGTSIELYVNAGLQPDLERLEMLGVQGVGLYRTELAFMTRPNYPDTLAQVDMYRQVFEAVGNKPILFRTLDIGGDKMLPYLPTRVDDNPLMGWRAVRMTLDQPVLFRQQIRALILAAQGRPLHIMVPMLTEVAEFDTIRHLVDLELERAYQSHITLPEVLKLGVVIEVPALIWQLPLLLTKVDFISVGTNDLFQFCFAADRRNHFLAERYDTLAPAFLKILHTIVEACNKSKVPFWLCGELTSQAIDALAMLALGFHKLSVPRAVVSRLRALIQQVDLPSFQALLHEHLDSPEHTLRPKIQEYLIGKGIEI